MTQELADSSYLHSGKALPEKDAKRSVRTYARTLFAEIAVRIFAYGADLVVIALALTIIGDQVSRFITLGDEVRMMSWALLLSAYFIAFWVSRLRATPLQYLFRMRVLHESGRTLSLREAAMRSVVLVALSLFAVLSLRFFPSHGMWVMMPVVASLCFVPSITARRQALHDFLTHSVVVNSRAIRSTNGERRMREFLADREVALSKPARPTIFKMLMDAVVLALPLLVMTIGIQVSQQKNLQGRVAYAMSETLETKQRVQAWYEATGNWPVNEAELGQPLRHNYPDGGYFRLEENGAIRIQFEVRPELKKGSILLKPQFEDGEVNWQCMEIGDIDRGFLPASCRD